MPPELQFNTRSQTLPTASVHRGDLATPVIVMSQTTNSPERWSGLDVAEATHRPTLTPVQIADLLQRLAGANHALAIELDGIAATRRPLCQSTVDRLESLAEQMRPAAQIRQILAGLDPVDLLAGAWEWQRGWPATPSPRVEQGCR